MTDIYEVQLCDIIPDIFQDSDKLSAFSIAERNVRRKILEFVERIFLYENLGRQPNQVLDMLAYELHTQYYSTDLPKKKKLELIKNTLKWHASAGTVSSVQELITSVFGEGSEVKEWFEYGGNPYYFKVIVPHNNNRYDIIQFLELIKKIKPTTAYLEDILISTKMSTEEYEHESIYTTTTSNI